MNRNTLYIVIAGMQPSSLSSGISTMKTIVAMVLRSTSTKAVSPSRRNSCDRSPLGCRAREGVLEAASNRRADKPANPRGKPHRQGAPESDA